MRRLTLCLIFVLILLSNFSSAQYCILEYYAVEYYNSILAFDCGYTNFQLKSYGVDKDMFFVSNPIGRYSKADHRADSKQRDYGTSFWLNYVPTEYVAQYKDGSLDNPFDSPRMCYFSIGEDNPSSVVKFDDYQCSFVVRLFDLQSIEYTRNGYLCFDEDYITLSTTFTSFDEYTIQCSLDGNSFRDILVYNANIKNPYPIECDLMNDVQPKKHIVRSGDIYSVFGEEMFSTEEMFFRIAYSTEQGDFNTKVFKSPQYYRNYPIKEANPTIKDNNLHATLQANDHIDIDSYFEQIQNGTFDSKNFDADGFLINKTGRVSLNGPYRLTFDREGNYCSVTYHAFVPDVVYNTVNSSDKVFWYPTQTCEAVTLAFKYPQGNDEQFNFVLTPNNSATHRWVDEDNGSIEVYSLFDDSKTETLNCKFSSLIFNTNSTLSTIEASVTSNDPSKIFIPVTINLDELKSYPNISTTVNIDQPHCNYSEAFLNVQDIHGGLKQNADGEFDSSAYSYRINGEGDFLELDNDTIELPQSLEEFFIVFYDRDAEKYGHDKRSDTIKNLLVKRPSPMQITDFSVSNLRCHNDFTGSIEIKKLKLSYPNEDVAYSWFRYPYEDKDKLAISTSKADSLSADTYQVVINNNDCILQQEFTITQPDTLLTSVTSVTNAMCYGYHDGAITTETTGGTINENEDYTYSWSNGATTKDIDHLPIGRYYLTVTDAHDCEAYANDSIQQPPELFNSLTPEYIICKGGELAIDDGKENPRLFTKYEWIQPDGTIKQGRPIVVDSTMPQGQYILKSINEDNCFTLDTTLITFAENDLPVKFLVPSESFLADTLVIAEDSEIDADFNWYYEYNSEMFKDITEQLADRNKNQTYLWVERSGCDTITMFAENGFCKASLSKTVTILNDFRPEGYDFTIAAAGIFSRLQIGPNPNNGEFTLFANLTEESELDVRLYDVSRSRRIPLDFSKYKTPSDRYQIPFQGLGLRTGIYTLLVSANGETKQIKFVVE